MAKILLIDDDPLMVRMYQVEFAAQGHVVEGAGDGVEGLAKIQSFFPDLILLDIMMPKMNGLEALAQIKQNENTKKIPVILLTNVGSMEEDIQKGLKLGAVAYLIKAQYTPNEIVSKVKEILGGYVNELPTVKAPIKS